MIERIRLVNFKNHADTRIELDRLTALIGPNSSGKTNVLQALEKASQSISDLRADGQNSFVSDKSIGSLIRRSQQTLQICIGGRTRIRIGDGQLESLSFRVKVSSVEKKYELHLSLQWDGMSEQNRAGSDMTRRALSRRLRQESGQVTYLKAIGKKLSEPSYSEAKTPLVESDGYGLASAVAYLKTYKEESFASVLKSLQLVVPNVKNIRVRPAQIQRTRHRTIEVEGQKVAYDEAETLIGHELVFDMVGADEITASAMSEGTLLVLGILTALCSLKSPNLVLIDDIEQGLHPKAQRELIAQLRKILEQRPELQIALTSHSPYIVDELEPEEVWLLATDDEGVAHARRLSDHPEAEQALEVLTTGEFWSAEGEGWVIANGE